MFVKKLPFAIGLVAAALAAMAPASASVLTWKIKSTYPYIIYVEFFSQDRNAVWPGGGQVYIIDDWDWNTYRLNCNRGETICYGAYTDSRSAQWGVGEADSMGCRDCCAVCGGAARQTTLTD